MCQRSCNQLFLVFSCKYLWSEAAVQLLPCWAPLFHFESTLLAAIFLAEFKSGFTWCEILTYFAFVNPTNPSSSVTLSISILSVFMLWEVIFPCRLFFFSLLFAETGSITIPPVQTFSGAAKKAWRGTGTIIPSLHFISSSPHASTFSGQQ